MNAVSSNLKNINVLFVIDTDYVKVNYSNPSTDLNNPTIVDNNSQYVICTDPSAIIKDPKTAHLNFTANRRDVVSVRSTSISGNSDDAVIAYAITHKNGAGVLSPFYLDISEVQNAVEPDINTQYGLPPLTVSESFISYYSLVKQNGLENFAVSFAIYVLAEDGETQNLFGYYSFDLTISI